MNSEQPSHQVDRFKALLVHAIAAMMLAIAFVSAWCGNTLAARHREVQLACAQTETFCPGGLPQSTSPAHTAARLR